MKMIFYKPILWAILLAGLLAPLVAWAGVTDQFWQDTAQRSLPAAAPQPAQFRALSLDRQQMHTYLRHAHSSGLAVEVSLPLPEGGFSDFTVVDSGTLPIELQQKYPDILSFRGSDAEGRRIRLDVSPLGFQAMVFDPEGIWVVRPETVATGTSQYLSYRRVELQMSGAHWQCETHGDVVDINKAFRGPGQSQSKTVTGVNQRVYRAAVAANSKYIAKVGGGTVVGGLAATAAAINRVNELYGHEMSIQFTLADDNDLIMYPDPNNDPFISNDSSVIDISTSVINGAIGSASYDIGHVFTTSGGGVAYLDAVCNSAYKARATTGLYNPIGDDFYIDLLAHEMGHQFGSHHSFNGSLSYCNGSPPYTASTAYEPGSGSTIMSYAGTCGGDSLQLHSDPYFHAISLQEMTNYTNAGGNCSDNMSNANLAPIIDASSLPSGMTIPAQTPFALNATASDPNSGDTLGYSWEQWDLGPQAKLSAGDNGQSPLFRSWPPKATGERVFPSMSIVLGGPAIKGEIMPTKTRNSMKFRLTVRDRSDDDLLGMGASQSADITLAVTANAGPFKVNSPIGGVTLTSGTTQTTTWDVAKTSMAPVSCNSVDIDLSTDGGSSFTHTLATGASNNGTANFVVPHISTTKARVRVKCSNNVFFNVSPGNFTIAAGGPVYSVGGTISGLTGPGLKLKLNSGSELQASGSATSFIFPNGLPNNSSYTVTISAQPSGQTCSITANSGTIYGADVTNVQLGCTDLTLYSVGGNISGLTKSGLKLRLNSGPALTVLNNATSFTFPNGLLSNSSYTVAISAQPLGQTCSITANSGTVNAANVTNVQLECADPPPETYKVGGTITGLNKSGLKLKLNGGNALTVLNNATSFTFPNELLNNSSYTVTISAQPPGQTCSITANIGTINAANVTNIQLVCADLPLYSVGGTISGLTKPGLKLRLNGGAALQVSDNATSFTFPNGLLSGSSYTVAISAQPPGQTCTLAANNGTINAANVTNVQLVCADPPLYSVGGTISGLTKPGLKLTLNGGSALQVSDNATSFTFPNGLLSNSSYTVAISAQPDGQTCSITAYSGTISAADVTSVQLECADLPPESYSVGGTISGLTGPGLKLSLNGGAALQVPDNATSFTFPNRLLNNSNYMVAISAQPDGQKCSISNESGTMGHADVTNVDVDCTELSDEIFADGLEVAGNSSANCSPLRLFQDTGFETTDASGTNPSWNAFDDLGGTPRWLNYWMVNYLVDDPKCLTDPEGRW